MANKYINTRIQQKRDTSANWTSKNPVLLEGELIVVDTENGIRLKIGDGTKTYTQLPFIDEVLYNSLSDKAKDSDLTAHIEDVDNPHEVTKEQIGLGNVENKSSATIREELTKEDVITALGYEPSDTDNNTTYTIYKSENDLVLEDSDGNTTKVPVYLTGVDIDEELSSESTNPVQNKVVAEVIDTLFQNRSVFTDANTCTTIGTHYCAPGAVNIPFDCYGMMLVYTKDDGAWYIQEFYAIEDPSIHYVRTWVNDTFSDWVKVNDGGNAATINTQYQAPITTANTLLYPTLVDSNNSTATAEAIKTNDSIKWQMKAGTTSATGYAQLHLGNSKQAGTEGNMQGQLVFFGPHHSYYAILAQNTAQTGNTNFYLPATGGTLALNTVAYGTCATAAATAAKVVTITGTTGWTLAVGSTVTVKFTNTNTASNCTLNVNNTGAKQIWYNNAVYTAASNTVNGYANRYIRYMYDGTYWVWMGYSLDANTWTAASATANGYVSTGTQTFAGAKTFNGVVKVAGATAAGTSQVRNFAAGTAAATTTNCPNGALYAKYS